MIPDITLVIGTDRKYLPQLKLSWRTWKANRKEFWSWPMVLFYDRSQLSESEMLLFVNREMQHPMCTLVAWPPLTCEHTKYESQRDRMLAAHVHVPAMHVTTKYHWKLDTDAVAGPCENWLEPEWFDGDPVWVCPRWGYSKGRRLLATLEDWADTLPHFANRPRLNIPQEHPDQLRVGHARMCSWCSAYLTDFTRLVAQMCNQTVGPCRLPVPSQDSTAWYVAERLGLPTRIVNMKRKNWSNHPKFHNLKAAADAILLQAEAVHA